MLGRSLKRGLALLLLGGPVLAACEQHPQHTVQGSPEYLHHALTGDVAAQGAIADCYDRGGCPAVPQDGALACAWRGVRAASHSPMLTLSNSTALAAACAPSDPTFRQRSAIAFAELAARVYGRPSSPLPQLLEHASSPSVLYPSIDAVRTRVAAELGVLHRSEHLPPFGAPTLSGDGQTLAWSSCAGAVCIEGVTPSLGGGVVSYTVRVNRSAGASAPQLAASLAAAALDAGGIGEALSRADPPSRELGGVCWRTASDSGSASVKAMLAPCRG